MLFYSNSSAFSQNSEYPFCILTRNSWNDWGYYSTFNLECYIAKDDVINFGILKIGKKGLKSINYYNNEEQKIVLDGKFENLSEDYFSLGASSDYYIKLYLLGRRNKKVAQEIEVGLRDIVSNPDIYEDSKNEDIFRQSLIRNISKKTIKDVFTKALHTGYEALTPYKFSIRLKTELTNKPMTFEVTPNKLPQSNIHTIIGRNGVGKTNLLKSIISTLTSSKELDENVIDTFEGKDKISSVLALSYSVFDTTLPKKANLENDIPYKFIGFDKEHQNTQKNESMDEIILNDFLEVVNSIKLNSSLFQTLTDSIATLNTDPIFSSLNVISWFQKENESVLGTLYTKLSSGHKIVLLSLLQIINNVEPNSLFLVDEPEQNLHPPLISSFIQAISVILSRRNAVAIIATHSPVIVQECSADCVWIIDRDQSTISIHRPTIKTFGENVGEITYNIFDLEVRNSGYMKVINIEIQKYNDSFFIPGEERNIDDDLQAIIDKFNNKLGDEAISTIANLLSIEIAKGEL